MVNNQQCIDCAFQSKCLANSKLKPFTDEARVDLGVELTFVSCNDFKDVHDIIEVDEYEQIEQ